MTPMKNNDPKAEVTTKKFTLDVAKPARGGLVIETGVKAGLHYNKIKWTY